MAAINKSPTKRSKDVNTQSNQGIAFGDDPNDIWKATRAACLSAILKTFSQFASKNTPRNEEPNQPDQVAKRYEETLYSKNKHSLNAYKLRFRKDLTALKNAKTCFAVDILSGDLTIDEFVNLDDKDLLSRKQKLKDSELLNTELKNSMGKQFPKSINQIKNQNLTIPDQWWASDSSAKIDPYFDTE